MAAEGGAFVTTNFYREHAQGSRELAVRLPDGETRRHLLDIAQKYDALAEQVEQQRMTRRCCEQSAWPTPSSGAGSLPNPRHERGPAQLFDQLDARGSVLPPHDLAGRDVEPVDLNGHVGTSLG